MRRLIIVLLLCLVLVVSGCSDYYILDSSGSAATTNDLNIYFDHSIKHNVSFYINESEESIINTYTAGGEKFIFGGDFT